MASCIAKAVEHWHTVNWVHQGICSHNIFLFTPRESNTKTRYDFSSPFLQGFDFSRPNAKPSLENHVEDLKYDVYRHPERQGPSREGHKKIHDLYSLGVVLLEIGTWGSAIDMIKRVTPEGRDVTKEDMFKWLKRHAKQRLAHHLGEEYQQAVMTCLNSDFGVSMDDDRNTMLANAFRERVLDKLASWKHVH
ncbi:hypothetical protein EJ04DRAFT_452812 [Polyplosphaeria fusca]|uniref:Protein kinase domain-containing protein n=1 Tax=Polyplosphaeria fusca TaxID=682080 RepID=A0A9P4QKR1_9PLEO|nr:hypothetical protein EJ04DRAFT_452812 [Polyplosphaeria fusca]